MITPHARPLFTLLIVVAILVVGTIPAIADPDNFVCTGKVVDRYKQPVSGYRVVYRQVDGTTITISDPTGPDGEYTVELPTEILCAPVAVISPRGKRIELNEEAPVHHVADARRDLQIDVPGESDAAGKPAWFPGSDRLFLSFVQDADYVDSQRYEVQVDVLNFDDIDQYISRVVAAGQVRSLPQVEFGGRFGWGALDNVEGLADENGPTDLDLWFKMHVASVSGGDTEVAVGALVTLPTGDEDALLGFDALSSELFGAVRHYFVRSSIAANLGVRFNEDGKIGDTRLQGETALTAGIGYTFQVAARTALIFEARYEGKRFKSFEADSSVLAGFNWSIWRHGAMRFAVSAGLQDGAPDTRFLVAYAADF